MDSFGSAYPVPLHGHYAFRPSVKLVETIHKFLGVVCYPYEPLIKCRFTTGVPQRQRTPSPTTCSLARTVLQSSHQLTGACLRVNKSLLVELEEEPLVPPILIHVAGLYPSSPVVAVRPLELVRHMFDVAPCPFCRRKFHFYSRVFRGHSESSKPIG